MIVPNTYIVRRNDTLPKIALAYTGNPERWRDIVRANPQLRMRMYQTPYGSEPMPERLVIGGTIFLPLNWPRVPRVRLGRIEMPLAKRAATGTVGAAPNAGQKCTPDPITNIKPYVYTASTSLWPGDLAAKWTGSNKKFTELNGANYDVYDFEINPYGDCTPTVWAGRQFKIPASWPDPPQGSTLWNSITMTGEPGGTTPGGTTPGGTTPGGTTPGGTTPGGTTPGGTTPGGTEPVGAQPVGGKEEAGKVWGIPTWIVVGGGILVGGAGVYLASRLMKKKSPSARELEARVATSRLQPPAPAALPA